MDISIIIPYNVNRGWLKQALNSAKSQQFSGTFEIIQAHSDASTAVNWNNGLKQAKGKFIKGLCEDDMLLPGCLQKLYDKAMQGFDLVCANAIHLNQEGETNIVKSQISPTVGLMAQDYGIHGGTVLYRRAALEVVGGMENTPYSEEVFLHIKLALAGYKFGYIDEQVYLYRKHENQKSMQGGYKDGEEYKARQRWIRDNFIFKYQNNQTVINS